VGERHLGRCTAEALALYLFLVTVANAEGLSFYGDGAIAALLGRGRGIRTRGARGAGARPFDCLSGTFVSGVVVRRAAVDGACLFTV
jgi:hypothetical protein